jgi:hypothetical protein
VPKSPRGSNSTVPVDRSHRAALDANASQVDVECPDGGCLPLNEVALRQRGRWKRARDSCLRSRASQILATACRASCGCQAMHRSLAVMNPMLGRGGRSVCYVVFRRQWGPGLRRADVRSPAFNTSSLCGQWQQWISAEAAKFFSPTSEGQVGTFGRPDTLADENLAQPSSWSGKQRNTIQLVGHAAN